MIENQLDMFKEALPDADSKGRTREDIERQSRSLKPETLSSIEFKDGSWQIEGKDADEWIALDRELHNESNSDMYKN